MQLSKTKIRQIEHIAEVFKLEPDRLIDALIKIGFDFPEKDNSAPLQVLTPEQKVKTVEEEALKKGWTYKQLWNKPSNRNYAEMGLICFINDLTIIGEVTEKHISLIHEKAVGGPAILNLYNNEAEQPWIKKVGGISIT